MFTALAPSLFLARVFVGLERFCLDVSIVAARMLAVGISHAHPSARIPAIVLSTMVSTLLFARVAADSIFVSVGHVFCGDARVNVVPVWNHDAGGVNTKVRIE